MDPKTLPNLDPKLRETYERVMGTTLKQPAPPGDKPKDDHTSAASPLTAAPSGHAAPVSAAAIAQMSGQLSHAPAAAPPTPSKNDLHVPASPAPEQRSEPQLARVHLDAQADPAPAPEKKKRKISPVFFVLAAVIFFLVYAFFWAKVLNLALPF